MKFFELKRLPFLIVLLIQAFTITANAGDFFGFSSSEEFAILLEEESEEEENETEKSEELKNKKGQEGVEHLLYSDLSSLQFSAHIYTIFKRYISTPIQLRSKLFILFHQLKSDPRF